MHTPARSNGSTLYSGTVCIWSSEYGAPDKDSITCWKRARFSASGSTHSQKAGALAAAVAAMHGHLTIAEVGAVYLGASIIAAAAPTPGGLGALEAAVVAGLTAVGMESGPAVAAVLSYRLVTYWLPILPGWVSFHLLERRDLI